MPVWFILLLPLLFVAGMSLVDTTDGIAMLGAYGWAYVRPVRKLYYNMNITLISILVALVIGGIEVLQVISTETGASGGIFDFANNVPFSVLGFYIIGIFLGSWIVSIAGVQSSAASTNLMTRWRSRIHRADRFPAVSRKSGPDSYQRLTA